MPSFLISSADELLSDKRIRHFDIHSRQSIVTEDWLPAQLPARIAIASGASCPDVLMNAVFEAIAGFYQYGPDDIDAGLESLSLHEPMAAVTAG